jgi:hypothetical protein
MQRAARKKCRQPGRVADGAGYHDRADHLGLTQRKHGRSARNFQFINYVAEGEINPFTDS